MIDKDGYDPSTSGKGFARTNNNNIAPDNYGTPCGAGKGFAKTDFNKKSRFI